MSSGPAGDDAEQREAADALLGRTIAGKFVIEAVIGVGAMGVVYRARQTALDKVVAIKVMRTGLVTDKTFAARFHREAKAASRLDHPNSIRIHDFGQEPDGLLYIAMDYLDGRDLLDVINDESPLSAGRIVEILSQALSALAVAHEMGVLHRDLKPENIMVLRGTNDDGSPTDGVKVCDFGIAKMNETREARGDGAEILTGGLVLGTPTYMPPEQAHGEPVDARSDLYSMGVVLYQMLTTRVPFDAPTPLAILFKVVNEEPPRPSSLRPGVDPNLEAVCLKAMSKKPEDRYPSARKMRAALRASVGLEGHPIADGEPPPSSPAIGMPFREFPPSSRKPGFLPMPVLTSDQSIEGEKPAEHSRWPWAWMGGTAIIAATGAFLLASMYRRPTMETAATVLSQSQNQTLPEAGVGLENASLVDPARGLPEPSATASTTESPAVVKPRKVKVAQAQDIELAPSTAAPPPTPPSLPTASIKAPAVASPPSTSSPAAIDAPRAPDPAAVYVEIGSATGTIGTTAASVNKALIPLGSKLSACYRAALPQPPSGPATLHIETNEDGVITEARLDPRMGAALRSCIVTAVRGRKISNVDTGNASADVPLWFKSR